MKRLPVPLLCGEFCPVICDLCRHLEMRENGDGGWCRLHDEPRDQSDLCLYFRCPNLRSKLHFILGFLRGLLWLTGCWGI